MVLSICISLEITSSVHYGGVQDGVEGPEVTQHRRIWQSDSISRMPSDPKEAKAPAVHAVSLGTLCHGRHPFGYSSGSNFL